MTADRTERQAAALRRLRDLCATIDEQTLQPGEKPLAQAIAETAKERLREIDKHAREGQ